MAEINSLSALSSTATSAASSGIKGALAQADFLKLLVAQMSHQDPLQPQDPGDFLGQLAQFGTVDGIGQLNASMTALGENRHANQALQAAAMVGRQVHIPSQNALLTENGLQGSIEISGPTPQVAVMIKNEQGQTIKTLTYGSQEGGHLDLQWDGKGDDGQQYPSGIYRMEAQGVVSGRNTAFNTFARANVDSVTIDPSSHDIVLNLQGLGGYALRDVVKLS